MRISDWSSDVCSSDLQKAVIFESAYWSIRKLIDEAVAAREPNPGKAVPTLEQGCRFENISFGYGRETVLEWASLEIPARGLTVITGASGSGKTTMTDLLRGFYQPQAGRILVDGVPLSEIDLQAWRGMIRSEEQTSELQSLMRKSYDIFC